MTTKIVSLASAELYDPGIGIVRNLNGRGAIDNQGNQITFDLRGSQSEAGTVGGFSFCDPVAGVCMTKTAIRSLSFADNSANFSGQAQLDDGREVRFIVSATDNGEPGTSDTISIRLKTNPDGRKGYSVSGTLISGDIRIQ